MKKIRTFPDLFGRPNLLKLAFIMNLTVALLLVSCLHVSAGVYSQSRVSLNMQSADIKKVLSAIEKRTSYRFLYNQSLLASDQKVTITAVNEEVLSVVNRVLQNTSLTYEVLNSNLVVLKRMNTIILPAQVTGRVTDSAGAPIEGVTVRIKGSTAGTSTNASGAFSLTVPDSGAVLVFSSVGYETQEVEVNGQTTINITLQASNTQLDQVVVVGYGTQRKRDLTGAVASVKGSDLAKQPVQTPTQAMQGRVAGVQVISSGAPNSLPIVRVRGTGTMLAGANPLYVVDGVITDDIRNINSADIVSMDVLKDASATAIYGMRAANGVLLITTKKGRTGKMVITYDGSVGIREATSLVDMAGPNQYAGYLNEASVYYGSGDSLVPASRLTGVQTDWFDAILRKGFQQNHNISLSGGSDKMNYFLSAGYISEEGILVQNKFNRFTLRSNNEYKISNKLRLSMLVSYSRADLDDVDANALNNAYRAAPYVPAKVDGKYGNTSAASNVANPLLQLESKYNKGIGNRVQGTFAFEYKPITWLTLRSSMGVDLDFYKNTAYQYKYLSDTVTFIEGGGNQQQPNSVLTITSNDASKWVWDNTATFSKTFDKHSINVLAGITAEKYNFNSLIGTRRDVPENKDQWFLNVGTTANATNAGSGDKWTRNSYIGRVNYSYDSRYLLTATMRADGTSRFGTDNRWGYFPSVGIGWNITSEDFMKDQTIFDNLKLRGSWGKVGNDNIGTSLYYSLARINVPYYFNGIENLGIVFDQVNDRNVQWEITEEFDLGLEFMTLNKRLTGEIDYYHKKTNDALVEINIPAILGDADGKYITNAANFLNTGVELSLNWNDKIGRDWTYSIGGNIAYNKNEIVGLNGGQALFAGSVGGQGNTTKSDNGQPIGSFFLWETDGIFQSEAEIAASAQKDAKPGDLRYKDLSGPDGKPDGVINDLDRAYQGAYIPKVTYGFNGTVTYKAFDLSLSAYGTAGGKIYNGKKATRGVDSRDNLESYEAKNRWTPNHTNTPVPRAHLGQLPASTWFLENGDFLRLNNLTIGYTLPKKWLDKARITNFRVYITGQNMLTITSYSGFTPELLPTGDRPTLNAGIELGSYPTIRTYAFGVNVGF